MIPILDKIELRFHCFARTPEEVIAAKGVKPTLSPNLDTLALVEVHVSFLHAIYFAFVISYCILSPCPSQFMEAKMGHES